MQIKNKLPIFDAEKLKVGLVVARFNHEITDGLLASAKEQLKHCKVLEKNITVISVAGCAEIPYALQRLALQKKYDCLVALGCAIRGETPHFDYVCKMAQEGILRVSLDNKIPIGFGIITTNNLKQAEARKGLGAPAVNAAIELVFC